MAAVLAVTACDGGSVFAPSTDPSSTVSSSASTTTLPAATTTTTLPLVPPPAGPDSGWSDADWGAGITVGYVPEGFSYLISEGNIVYMGHRFANEDETVEFSVAWFRSDSPRWGEGQEVTRRGTEYYIEKSWRWTRILREVGEDEVIGVMIRRIDGGPKVDVATLWLIAESVIYEPVGND